MVGDHFVADGNFVRGADKLPEAQREKVCPEVTDRGSNFYPCTMSIWVEHIPIVKSSRFSLAEGIRLTQFGKHLSAWRALLNHCHIAAIARSAGRHNYGAA